MLDKWQNQSINAFVAKMKYVLELKAKLVSNCITKHSVFEKIIFVLKLVGIFSAIFVTNSYAILRLKWWARISKSIARQSIRYCKNVFSIENMN